MDAANRGVAGLVLVVPCYNEELRLNPSAFLDFTEREAWVRILFVNDGSTDSTTVALDRLAAAGRGMEVLELERNSGKGEAVRRGMLAALDAGAEYVGYWDADLSTPFSAVGDFRAVFAADPAVQAVIGARAQMLGRSIDRRPARHYLGRVFATAASAVLGLRVYDTQCGAKIFRASDALRSVLTRPFRSRWVFDVELLARLGDELRARELAPLERCAYELTLREWHDVEGSKLRLRDWIVAGGDLARIWLARHAARADIGASATAPVGRGRPISKPGTEAAGRPASSGPGD